MPPSKIRFVTACQQILALGVVLAVLTPATNVISLDVVHDRREAGVVIREAAADRDAPRQAEADRVGWERWRGGWRVAGLPAAEAGAPDVATTRWRPTPKGSEPRRAPRRTSR